MAIQKELSERLQKVDMELININQRILELETNNINIYIDSKKLNGLIHESKKFVELLLKLPQESIKKLNNVCGNSRKDDTNSISNSVIRQLKESVKKHMFILTRAQKRKLQLQQQEQKRKERKERIEEEEIWNEVKEEVF